MNREIKFEYGFGSINGIIKKQYYLHEIPNIANICDVWNVLPLVYIRQYIGRKDKNGREIYGGDICKINDLYCDIITVQWHKLGFRGIGEEHHAIDSNGGFPNNGYDLNCYKLEVIGNIYENK